ATIGAVDGPRRSVAANGANEAIDAAASDDVAVADVDAPARARSPLAEEAGAARTSPTPVPRYETVLDDERLEWWIRRIEAADLVAFDT
ncbi:hypothetical protein ACXWP3_09415, partial [Streptococcus pyogenes]